MVSTFKHDYQTHDLLEAGKILGHRSLLTTSKYTHLTSTTAKNSNTIINELITNFSIQQQF